jgi:hypothetical protein
LQEALPQATTLPGGGASPPRGPPQLLPALPALIAQAALLLCCCLAAGSGASQHSAGDAPAAVVNVDAADAALHIASLAAAWRFFAAALLRAGGAPTAALGALHARAAGRRWLSAGAGSPGARLSRVFALQFIALLLLAPVLATRLAQAAHTAHAAAPPPARVIWPLSMSAASAVATLAAPLLWPMRRREALPLLAARALLTAAPCVWGAAGGLGGGCMPSGGALNAAACAAAAAAATLLDSRGGLRRRSKRKDQ